MMPDIKTTAANLMPLVRGWRLAEDTSGFLPMYGFRCYRCGDFATIVVGTELADVLYTVARHQCEILAPPDNWMEL